MIASPARTGLGEDLSDLAARVCDLYGERVLRALSKPLKPGEVLRLRADHTGLQFLDCSADAVRDALSPRVRSITAPIGEWLGEDDWSTPPPPQRQAEPPPRRPGSPGRAAPHLTTEELRLHHSSRADGEIYEGVVESYSPYKGYGFITPAKISSTGLLQKFDGSVFFRGEDVDRHGIEPFDPRPGWEPHCVPFEAIMHCKVLFRLKEYARNVGISAAWVQRADHRSYHDRFNNMTTVRTVNGIR